jgi:hypothetical protein
MNSTTTLPAIATTTAKCDRSPFSLTDRTTIARVLTWDMQEEIEAHEVITIAIVNGIVQVKLTGGQAALLSADTFKLILAQQQQADEDAAYVERLERKLEKDSAQIEVDKGEGKVYRVWFGIELLGTFYRLGNKWVAEPKYGREIHGLGSANAAQNAIASAAMRDVEIAAA